MQLPNVIQEKDKNDVLKIFEESKILALSISFLKLASAYFLRTVVRAVRKPASCVPPSMVLMLLTYEWIFSE